jgi:Family of unknown function (DUF5681)
MSRTGKTRRPPVGTRFQKGVSGNPKGRPKGSRQQRAVSPSAFDIVLDKTLPVTLGGVARELTVEEALHYKTYQEAIAGNRAAQRKVLKMIAKREAYLAAREGKPVFKSEMRMETVDPENADAAMLMLGIASRDPQRQDYGFEREQLKLEPWAVQAALSRRRGGQRLTDKDIADIVRCTRDPGTIKWPRGTHA